MLLRLHPPSAPARSRLYYCVMRFWASSIRRFVPATFSLVLALTALRAPFAQAQTPRIADFEDVAEKAGLTMMNIFGGVDTKKYIIETTGTGVAIFDYDNDGWPDIFIVNGTTRSEEHTSELQSRQYIVCRLLLEKKKRNFSLKYI